MFIYIKMKRRLCLIIGVIFIVLITYVTFTYIRLNKIIKKDCIYLIFRGSDSKYGRVITEFNQYNRFENHVGVLVYQEKNWFVFHYIDTKLEGVFKEKLDLFITHKNITRYSIWKIEDFCYDQNPRTFLNDKKFNTIKYDMDFSLNNNDLYCSEFVTLFLEDVDSIRFNFIPQKIKIGNILGAFFGRDTLEYYPVDIFQTHPDIIKVYEWER